MQMMTVRRGGLAVAALALCAMVWAAQSSAGDTPDEHEKARSSFLAGGYLVGQSLPDSLTINPPPPAEGSAAMMRDEAGATAALALRGTLRFELAGADAAFFMPNGESVFSCAAGFVIDPETTPRLNALLRKSVADLALAVYPTKNHYQRPRPFMVNKQPTCTPDQESMLERDGSYPSGHSAIGYGWGLILAEIVPDRATQLVARAREFGESRRICNVHWLSDVEEGMQVAAAVVARLHADPAFLSDVEAARLEFQEFGPKLAKPDCTLELKALGTAG